MRITTESGQLTTLCLVFLHNTIYYQGFILLSTPRIITESDENITESGQYTLIKHSPICVKGLTYSC